MEPSDEGWYERPNAYEVGDKFRIRASAIGGGCVTALAYDAYAWWTREKGEMPEPAPFNEHIINAMEESAALEQQAYERWWDEYGIEGLGWTDGPDAELVRLDLGDDRTVEGTTDFSIQHDEHPAQTVEIKVVGKALFKDLQDTRAKPWRELTGLPLKYRWQVASYVHGQGRPCVLAVCEKEGGGLTGKVTSATYGLEYQKKGDLIPTIEEMTDRVDAVITQYASLLGGTRGAKVDGGLACSTTDSKCRWAEACQQPVELEGPEDVEFAVLMQRYEAAKKRMESTEERLAAAKEGLQQIADQHGGRVTSKAGKVTVTTSEIAESTVTRKAHTRTTVRITPTKKDS